MHRAVMIYDSLQLTPPMGNHHSVLMIASVCRKLSAEPSQEAMVLCCVFQQLRRLRVAESNFARIAERSIHKT